MSLRSLAAAGAILGFVLAGCGGSGAEPTVQPAVDQSAEIAKTRRQLDRLRGEAARDRGLESLLDGLPGRAGVVIGPAGTGGPSLAAGEFETGDAWSTIKVPIAERVLADAGGPDGLTADQAGSIDAAITLSDNDAAATLFDGLEAEHGGLAGASESVGAMLRRAGDDETVISTEGRGDFSTYGQTDWSLEAQFAYMAALAGGCVGDAASRTYLLDEMASVGGSDTFGLGSTGLPARWKGGWGPGEDGGYLVRQMGVVEVDGREVVVAMAAVPDDGSFESGTAMLDRIAAGIVAEPSGRFPAWTGC